MESELVGGVVAVEKTAEVIDEVVIVAVEKTAEVIDGVVMLVDKEPESSTLTGDGKVGNSLVDTVAPASHDAGPAVKIRNGSLQQE